MYRDFTLLIADDEPLIRELLAAELKPLSARQVEAEDGQAAVDAVRAGAIDVAILDMRMPRLGGLAALEIIAAESPDTVCIVFTGNGDFETAKACLRAGAYDFLEKPHSHDDLLATVRRAFEKALLHRERRALLELLVYEVSNIPTEAFRALEPRRQAEVLQLARGTFSMMSANKAAAGEKP